jgi:hypothetical protein
MIKTLSSCQTTQLEARNYLLVSPEPKFLKPFVVDFPMACRRVIDVHSVFETAEFALHLRGASSHKSMSHLLIFLVFTVTQTFRDFPRLENSHWGFSGFLAYRHTL